MLFEWMFLKKNWGAFLTVFAVWALYLYLTIEGPVNTQSQQIFSLSILQLRLLQLSVAIPYLLIWLVIMYGILQLDRYRRHEDKNQRKLFSFITAGIAFLGSSTVLSALIGAVRSYTRATGTTELYKTLTLISNYLHILFPFLAFCLILFGISRTATVGKIFNRENIALVTILIFLIGGFYIPLVFTNDSRNAPTSESVTSTYFLSDSMIISTVIIPLLITWAAAFLAVLSLNDVRMVRDTGLAKKGVKHLIFGIWFIIIASMLLQSLLSLGGGRLLSLGLGFILFLIYQFLILEAVGYMYISSAARKFVRDKLQT